MQIPDEIRLGVELFGLLGTGGMIMFRLGRLGERFDSHATKLEKVEEKFDKVDGKIDKIEDTLATVAEQKVEIRSIRDAQAANTTRTDETFSRVFSILDRLQSGPARG